MIGMLHCAALPEGGVRLGPRSSGVRARYSPIHISATRACFSASAAADLGLGARVDRLHQDDLRAGHINALKHGIIYADAITTVSPTYAAEICTPEYGHGPARRMRARRAALSGILNGAGLRRVGFAPRPLPPQPL